MFEMIGCLAEVRLARGFEGKTETFARVTPVSVDLIFKVRRFPQPDDGRSTFIVPDPDRCIDKRLKMLSFEITQRVRPFLEKARIPPKGGSYGSIAKRSRQRRQGGRLYKLSSCKFHIFTLPEYIQKPG
jgi:hypothetical protein